MNKSRNEIVDRVPDFPGSYIIGIKIEKEIKIEVGALGVNNFLPGYYYYCGSAKKGIKKRIKRYLVLNRKVDFKNSGMKQRPKEFWHIDYLLTNSAAHIISLFFSASLTECELANDIKTFEKTEIPFPGFGASDCKNQCGAHLFYSGDKLVNLNKDKFDQHFYLK